MALFRRPSKRFLSVSGAAGGVGVTILLFVFSWREPRVEILVALGVLGALFLLVPVVMWSAWALSPVTRRVRVQSPFRLLSEPTTNTSVSTEASAIAGDGTGVVFYEDRAALNRLTGGGLVTEIESARTVWLATFTGDYAANHDAFRGGRIARLVLLHPHGEHIATFARGFNETADELRSKIERTTRLAQQHGVEVRWFDGHFTGMLLVNPDDSDGWARIEVAFPYYGDRTSYRIAYHHKLYPPMYGAFDRLWKGSVEAQQSEAVPDAEAPAPASQGNHPRGVFDAKGGSIKADGVRARNQETVFKTEDTDVDARNIDVE